MSDLISRQEAINSIKELFDEEGKVTEAKIVQRIRRLQSISIGRPNKLDHGKIVVLHRAGWSAKKIADEMRCTTAAVYNHLKRERTG